MERSSQEARRPENQTGARKADRQREVPTPGPNEELASRAARSNCTILITGETGVGKGHMAKWMHKHSPLAGGPFVPVNCGAIPETLVDSQLFGHVRGAFSGATSDHLGLIRAAEKGTLFLDEIGVLPPSAQIRLLRLLQDKEVQPVGMSRPIEVNLRVIAATNTDLEEEVANKRFREDLLFRLDVVRIRVGSLRERRGELSDLMSQFNREFAELYNQPELEFDSDAMRFLRSYPWPGNIRQLRTVVERLHVLCPEESIDIGRLIEVGQLNDPASAPTAPRSFEDVKHEELQRVLDESGGSVARAAAVFGVHRSTIYRWIRSRPRPASQSDG